MSYRFTQEELEDVPAEPLNPADFAAAEAVDGSKPAHSEGEEDKMWNAGMFEGDIADFDPSVGKNAIRGDHFKWPQSTVPCEISRFLTRGVSSPRGCRSTKIGPASGSCLEPQRRATSSSRKPGVAGAW